jgi:nucleotidyltransferase substrate binding protein (TIGR01987 family)
MTNPDVRWKQRFSNFSKAFAQLKKFIEKSDTLNELEKQGLIQSFEYNYELSWNLLKDFLEYQGITDIIGSRDTFRLAFNRGLIKDGEKWMKMINSRIKSTHTYDEETADEIAGEIISNYFYLFSDLHETMEKIINEDGD